MVQPTLSPLQTRKLTPSHILVTTPQIIPATPDVEFNEESFSDAGSSSPNLSISGSTTGISSGPQTPTIPLSQPPSPFPWSTVKPDLDTALANLDLKTNDKAPPSPLLTPRAVSTWGAQLLSKSVALDGGLLTPNGTVQHRSGLRTPTGFEHLDFGADYFSSQQEEKRPPRSFEWEVWSDPMAAMAHTSAEPPSPSSRPDTAYSTEVWKRRMGPNEVSYYLGSRGAGPSDAFSGVNDMYLHIGFKAPPHLMTRDRVLDIWTELRCRHTLLTSSVDYEGFEDIHFVHVPARTYEAARESAARAFDYRQGVQTQDILNEYLNGARTLSDDMLAKLMITTTIPSPTSSPARFTTQPMQADEDMQEYNFWLLATHFLGDGMALHSTANEFFELLGGGFESLKADNKLEWNVETRKVRLPPMSRLPPALEARIETPAQYGRLAWAAARVEFQRNQGQLIGGQTFPRAKLGARKTLVPTVAFTPAETSKILKSCKAGGVTIAHAVFALANVAHIKVTAEQSKAWDATGADKTLPMMLYSALNLRPNMTKGPEEDKGVKPDFFHLVIGYYNVILPAFQPTDLTLAQTFWHRARQTKAQTVKAVKSPWLAQRSKLMSLERERRAIGFEREDERRRKARANAAFGSTLNVGLGLDTRSALAPVTNQESKRAEAPKGLQIKIEDVSKPKVAAAPSLAFLGVSMLGNLDGMYKHANFPSIEIHTLTTGSRQRPGAMLLFAYTLAGRLFLSLGYDVNAYPEGVVEQYFQTMLDGVQEYLIGA